MKIKRKNPPRILLFAATLVPVLVVSAVVTGWPKVLWHTVGKACVPLACFLGAFLTAFLLLTATTHALVAGVTLLRWRLSMGEALQSAFAGVAGTSVISLSFFLAWRYGANNIVAAVLFGTVMIYGVFAIFLLPAAIFESAPSELRVFLPWYWKYWRRVEDENQNTRNYWSKSVDVSELWEIKEIQFAPLAAPESAYPEPLWIINKWDWLTEIAAHRPKFKPMLEEWRDWTVSGEIESETD